MDEHTAETHQFKAEISQLLQILVHSLYKERDIFLRELISNASDALTRMRFELLTNRDVVDPETELTIQVKLGEEDGRKQIIVQDNGVGMNRDELVYNLGTIAQSGAREFLQKLKDDTSQASDIIGQFGVGFYSAFMVADQVQVISRSYRPEDQAVTWISSGDEEFQIEIGEKENRGTEIYLRLREDAEDFANEAKLRQIVKKYSDFVNYPVLVGGEKANQQLPLWRKNPSEVVDAEYDQFYQQNTMDFSSPLIKYHISSDSPLHIRSILFVPSSRERSALNLRQQPGLKLYSHNVLIQDYCTDLLPVWLEFVDGIVESEDIPLNVSRESIQNNPIIRRLGKAIQSRTIKEIRKLGEIEDMYGSFWSEYGRHIKEGLATDPESAADLIPLLRFRSSQSRQRLMSLNEYVSEMGEEQEEIYYILGNDWESVALSPHLDPLSQKGIKVLFLLDPIDVFIAPIIEEHQEYKFVNIADATFKLPGFIQAGEEPDNDQDKEDPNYNRLIGRIVTTLGDKILEVRSSKLLRSSPVRLVSPEGDPTQDVQRLLLQMDKNYQIPKKIFEVNRSHPLIIHLKDLINQQPDDELIDLSILQLYENALILEGLQPNPASSIPQVTELLNIAMRRSLKK